MSGPVQAVAPGKVNLCFLVGPLREDGYHSVASLYAAVDQLETVQLELDPQRPAGSVGCELRVVAGSLVAQQEAAGAFDPTLVPLDECNLAVRAAQAVLAEAPDLPSGLMLRIAKAVPVAGGMGGGSADAAAALSAAAELIARETGKPRWEAVTEVEAVIAKVEISVKAYAERTGQRRLEGATYEEIAQAGGGIVADSVPETEYEESENKAAAVLTAAAAAGRAHRVASSPDAATAAGGRR